MKSLKDVKAQLLANPAVRQAYDAQAPEFELARELIAARMRAGLTQGDVAALMGTTQSVVARHPCEPFNALPMPWERVPWCAWSLFDMVTSIRLAPETEQRLDFLASQTGRTKAFYLREMIEQGIEEMEDYYLAADVLARVRDRKELVHSAADVRRDLGMDERIAGLVTRRC